MDAVRQALAASAESGIARYRSLFEAIDEGFCIIEMLWDAAGEPADYRFLEVNAAFVRHTGLADAVGRTVRDMVPGHDAHWFTAYGRVARTGHPVRFEDEAVALGRVFDVYALPVEGAADQVAVLFTDITERRRRERNLAFLAALGEEMDRLSTADEIVRAAGARAGAFLGLARCDVCVIDEAADEVRIVTAWTADGARPAPARMRLSDFVGAWFTRAARAGEPVVVADIGLDPRTRQHTEAHAAAGVRAWVAVPVIVDRASHELRVLVANSAEPRDWRLDEIELLHELAGRLVPRMERAQAQEAVRDRDARLRLALEASGAGTFVWYPEEDRAEPDERMRELLALTPGAPVSLARALDVLVHPNDRVRTAAAVARALDPAGDGLYVDEVHLVTPSGDDRWLSLAGRVTFGGDPRRATQMFGMATDVTARRRAEEALRAREARHAFLVRLNDALRPLWRPAAIRQAAAGVLQDHLAADRVMLVDRLPRGPAGGLGGLVAQTAVLAADGPTAIDDVAESPLLSARGRSLAATMGVGALLIAPVTNLVDGAGALIVTAAAPRRWRAEEEELAQEVADRASAAMERARAAATVRESERRLRRALAIETVGVIFFDRDGTLTDANDAFLRASGYARDELDRGTLTWETLAPADAREASRAALTDLRRRGRTEPRELEYVRRDGTRWPALSAATMLSRAEGVEFVVDLTEVRAAREAARAERAVRERREREFVANAAHELRTPLTAIIGAVQALQAGAIGIPEERERFLAHLGREAARLARLSDSLLVLAQIDGTRPLPRAPVALLDVLEDVAADLPVAPGVEVLVEGDAGLAVTTNQGLVERVVANVAENAAKHTVAGRVTLSARRDGGTAVVEVRDTGPGVDAATAERAFDRFYRAGERSADGFGLGLAIARQAAAAVGGTVALTSAPGGGTVARLVLPAA